MGEELNVKNNEGIINSGEVITENEIREARKRFKKYKDSKQQYDERLKSNENFWKMRHWDYKATNEKVNPTGWLLSAVHSKHADMMDGFPEANIRAQEESDVGEAKTLSEIIPVIFRKAGFKKVYNKACRDKINKGTGVYGIFWDSKKNFGKGDISIKKINMLNLFFEPEIEDIQDSKEVFLAAELDRDTVKQMYPQLKDAVSTEVNVIEKHNTDETVDNSNKCIVFDWYYKKWQNGRTVLHYCKFVDNTVLYASENDTEVPTMPQIDIITGQPAVDEFGNEIRIPTGKSRAETGWYEHGCYPFVFDVMFPVDNAPYGWGYTDLFGGTQEDIDVLNHAIIKNAVICANPRFFYSQSAGINLDDYADMKKTFIPCQGNVSEGIKQVEPPQMPGMVVNILNNKVEELKEVSGNRDVNNGSTSSGVTAASAIAALQEHAGKTSRDSIQNTYDAFESITYQVIELIRQFYDSERTFRIIGNDGAEYFTRYSNAGIKPQDLGDDFGNAYGYRIPQFDIVVSAQKATAYSKLSQNEFALQLYQAGMFAPQNTDVALAAIELMEFDDKDKVMQKIQRNGTLFEMNQMLTQIAMELASKYEPGIAQRLLMTLQGQKGMPVQSQTVGEMPRTNSDGTLKSDEHAVVEKAREKSQNSTQVS